MIESSAYKRDKSGVRTSAKKRKIYLQCKRYIYSFCDRGVTTSYLGNFLLDTTLANGTRQRGLKRADNNSRIVNFFPLE